MALATASLSRPGPPCTDNGGLSTQIPDARVKLTSSGTTSQELARVCSEAIERPGDIGSTPCWTRAPRSTSKPMVTEKEI